MNILSLSSFSQWAVLFFLLFFITGCSVSFPQNGKSREIRTKETEEAVERDYKLKQLDELCKRVPSFEDYLLITKHHGERKKYISYFYSSDSKSKVNYSQLKNFYMGYFGERGWKLIDDRDFGSKWVEFEKDGDYVMVVTAPDYGMDYGRAYAIECSETAYSK